MKMRYSIAYLRRHINAAHFGQGSLSKSSKKETPGSELSDLNQMQVIIPESI